MIKIRNLTKKFKNKNAINKISVDIENGVYGLLGPNGAGKTTFIRCLTGVYKYNEGEIQFNDISMGIGYLPQSFGGFGELTLYEILEYFCTLKNLNKENYDYEIKRVLEIVNLTSEVNNRVKNLSGGMIRRLGIAQAILGDPKIIIFDEPTVGLDPEERLRFKNVISKIKNDKVIIISTHIVEDVEVICNKILVMKESQIVFSGSVDDIIRVSKDKVFEVENEEISNIDSKYFIMKNYEKDNKVFNRVLSNKVLNKNKLEETIEDGYLCILKEI